MCVTKKKNSTLSSLEALEVVDGLQEWVHRSGLKDRAVRLPLLVFLLTLGAVGLAHTVNGHVPRTYLVNAMQIHASLSEQIFTPRLIAEIFLTPQVVQRRLAIINFLDVFGRGLLADDLKVPEEAEINVLAILKVDAIG